MHKDAGNIVEPPVEARAELSRSTNAGRADGQYERELTRTHRLHNLPHKEDRQAENNDTASEAAENAC
jgi:hypothetical protein